MSVTTQIWSCGGGVQSAAIAAGICTGLLPKPDVAVMADTSREASATWAFFENHMCPQLAAAGVTVHIVGHEYATVDLLSKNGEHILMPMYSDKSGKVSKLPVYCSNEWKVRPIHRWLKEHGYKSGHMWIGFSTDEMGRMRTDSVGHTPVSNFPHRYVLIEKRMSRDDCVALAHKFFGVMPPRSSCFMCPNRSQNEWAALKKCSPDDFAQAASLERELRQHDNHVWLTDQCKPLDEIDFDERQADAFHDDCDSGMCFV